MKYFAVLLWISAVVLSMVPVRAGAGGSDVVRQLLVTPSAENHRPFVDAILSAQKSVRMMMFHLSDDVVIEALITAAAPPRSLEVQVILDRKTLERSKGFQKAAQRLIDGKVQVRPSSPAFSLTHAKSMLVDDRLAFITAINLTRGADRTRDFGITTEDPGILAEMKQVFQSDWSNFENKNAVALDLKNPHLVWSPVNSLVKIKNLLGSVSRGGKIAVQVENLGDSQIQNTLANAVTLGAEVRLLVPECDKNSDPLFNYDFMDQLKAKGVQVRVMPAPESPLHPYMHSKLILVDGKTAYTGSINFSRNSTSSARELGVIFTDAKAVAEMQSLFERDWKVSVEPKNPRPDFCPKMH